MTGREDATDLAGAPAVPVVPVGRAVGSRLHVVRRELEPRELGPGGDDEPYTLIDVRPVSRLIGAEIHGLSLATPPDRRRLAELKRAFLQWKVLFFRDQHLTPAQQVDFARLWGPVDINPLMRKTEFEAVERLEHDAAAPGTENVWHSDASFSEAPPLGAVLRAVRIPSMGGDTIWADMAAAYDGLPEAVKARIAGLRAVHQIPASSGGLAVLLKSMARSGPPPTEHPVVRTHPQNGRRILYVNPAFTSHIVGMPDDASEELLALLFRQALHPEYQVRFQWTQGAVALWDNRSTLHYGVNDYYPHYRHMERVSIAGDRPF